MNNNISPRGRSKNFTSWTDFCKYIQKNIFLIIQIFNNEFNK